MTIESLWTFVTEQPGVVVSWLILASVVGYLGLALLFAIWAEREERRQAEQVERMQRYMTTSEATRDVVHRCGSHTLMVQAGTPSTGRCQYCGEWIFSAHQEPGVWHRKRATDSQPGQGRR